MGIKYSFDTQESLEEFLDTDSVDTPFLALAVAVLRDVDEDARRFDPDTVYGLLLRKAIHDTGSYIRVGLTEMPLERCRGEPWKLEVVDLV